MFCQDWHLTNSRYKHKTNMSAPLLVLLSAHCVLTLCCQLGVIKGVLRRFLLLSIKIFVSIYILIKYVHYTNHVCYERLHSLLASLVSSPSVSLSSICVVCLLSRSLWYRGGFVVQGPTSARLNLEVEPALSSLIHIPAIGLHFIQLILIFCFSVLSFQYCYFCLLCIYSICCTSVCLPEVLSSFL